ncbi:MAG: efflux transporter outer membrane subunit [Pseudomonadota bacterium]
MIIKRHRQLWFGLILACGLFTLSSCTTLGPDYQEPEVGWLDKWEPVGPGQVSTTAAPDQVDLRFWWHQFNDPVLNGLIAEARRENYSLRIAGLRIFESRALLGIAGSSRYPQVQQATGAINYVNAQGPGGGSNQGFASYSAGFNMAWELDFWGRFKRGIESADAAFFASVANQQAMQVLISAQVTDLYYAYRTTAARIAIALKNAAIQKRSYDITEKIFKSGDNSELDVQQARTQYLATLSTVPSLEITLAATRNALGVLLGRPPGDIPELAAAGDTLPDQSVDSVRDIPANLLLRRPDVRAAAWQVAAQSAQIGIAEAEYYPAISLLGGLGWTGSSLSGTSDSGSFTLGPALRWNIFDYGRIKNNVRLQDARLQQLIEAYQQAVLEAAREIDTAVFSVVKTKEQQAVIDGSVQAAERALQIANTRYREGYADFQRVIEAQRSLFAQSERQLVNQGSHISAVISLYKGLGGGWVATPVDQLIPADIRETMKERSNWGDLLTAPIAEPLPKPPSNDKAVQDE